MAFHNPSEIVFGSDPLEIVHFKQDPLEIPHF